MKRKFAKPRVNPPSPTNWKKKEYKSPLKMLGPTKWVTAKIQSNGKNTKYSDSLKMSERVSF